MEDQRPAVGAPSRGRARAASALAVRMLRKWRKRLLCASLGTQVGFWAIAGFVVILLVVLMGLAATLVGASKANASACDPQGALSTTAVANADPAVLAAHLDLPPQAQRLAPVYTAAAAQPMPNASGRLGSLGPDGPAVLAAINRVETNFWTNRNQSSAGARGPMQFLQSTFDNPQIGAGGNIYDEHDAIFAAARYLRRSGAPEDWYTAIFTYNRADWYVQEVAGLARQFGAKLPGISATPPAATALAAAGPSADGGCGPGAGAGTGQWLTSPGSVARILPNGTATIPADAPPAVQAMIAAGNELQQASYGTLGHRDLLQTLEQDCSSTTAYVLHRAGLLPASPVPVSSDFLNWGQPDDGKPHWVTTWAKPGALEQGHVFIVIAGLRLDTNYGYDTGPHQGQLGPRWREGTYGPNNAALAEYTPRHPAGL